MISLALARKHHYLGAVQNAPAGWVMTERERRAYNSGIEAAAQIADLWADESILMADDTLRLDPILNAKQWGKPTDVKAALQLSARLQDEGAQHAVQHHCAKDIAAMIRQQKVPR